jgi:glycerophosphoryl diester phosphodiesterase
MFVLFLDDTKHDIDSLIAHFTFARKDVRGRKMPQAIAHRGYKAEYPENTMKAFEGAVKVGAHAVETDIHLTKDDVVVLSHVCVQRPVATYN